MPEVADQGPVGPDREPEDEEQGSDRELHAPLGFVGEGASAGQVADADTDGKKKKDAEHRIDGLCTRTDTPPLRERMLSVQVNE